MSFLKHNNIDILQSISKNTLNEILENNIDLDLGFIERASIQKMNSKLAQRYDTTEVFSEFVEYSEDEIYFENDRVYFDDTTGTAGSVYRYYYNINSDTAGTSGIALSDTTVWKLGDNRNSLIIEHLVNLMLYSLYLSINYKKIPDERRLRYEESLQFLDDVSKANLQIDLPEINSEDAAGYSIRFGRIETKNRF